MTIAQLRLKRPESGKNPFKKTNDQSALSYALKGFCKAIEDHLSRK